MTGMITAQLFFFVLGTVAVSKFLIDYSSERMRLNFSGITTIGVTVVSFLLACLM